MAAELSGQSELLETDFFLWSSIGSTIPLPKNEKLPVFPLMKERLALIAVGFWEPFFSAV